MWVRQGNFLAAVDSINTPPGSYWVRIPEGTTHKVYKPGYRFLVVEEREGGWLLCWRNGVRPEPPVLGTIIHRRHIEREEL